MLSVHCPPPPAQPHCPAGGVVSPCPLPGVLPRASDILAAGEVAGEVAGGEEGHVVERQGQGLAARLVVRVVVRWLCGCSTGAVRVVVPRRRGGREGAAPYLQSRSSMQCGVGLCLHHVFCSHAESSLCPLCSLCTLCSACSPSACPTHCFAEAMVESGIDLRALSSVSDCCAPIGRGGCRGC